MRNKILIFIVSISIYSCEKSDFFKWNLVGPPTLGDFVIKSSTLTQFTLEAKFKNTGNDKDASLGFVISKTVVSPDLNNCDTVVYLTDNKSGVKNISIPWYTNGVLKCRAFIKNKIQTVYSDMLSISWMGGNANLPVVQSILPSEISFFKAKCGSTLISNGGLAVTKLGVLVSTQTQPSLSNSQIIEYNSGSAQFVKEIANLNDNTIYYCRGFAENLAGTSYANNIFQFTTKNYYNVGEQGPAGGIIFYSKFDTLGGWNFLESAPNDLNVNLPWGLNTTQQIILSTGIGDGEQNTTSLVNAYSLSGSNYAAKFCFTYVLSGYDDWFLPSRDEMITLYQNLYLENLGSFTSGAKYWTSSDDDYFNQNAWCQKMLNSSGTVNSVSELKTVSLKVRPIRCF
jgi:hypothetical protein